MQYVDPLDRSQTVRVTYLPEPSVFCAFMTLPPRVVANFSGRPSVVFSVDL
jgi:hypothetical protein